MLQSVDIQFPAVRELYEKNKAEILDNSSQESSFPQVLKQSIAELNDDFLSSQESVKDFLLGKGEIQDVLMDVQKVNMEFRLAVQVRNKLIEAYQEIMRMAI